MQRNSEFPLFVQTSALLFGFLLLISLFSYVTVPKVSHQGQAIAAAHLANH